MSENARERDCDSCEYHGEDLIYGRHCRGCDEDNSEYKSVDGADT
jgi:hypothetical protein